jgi:hypothetical protein
MIVRHEAIQQFLSEGLQAARAARMPREAQDAYCAAYLAQKLADLKGEKALSFTSRERDDLADWMVDEPVSSREVFRDLDWVKVASIVRKASLHSVNI